MANRSTPDHRTCRLAWKSPTELGVDGRREVAGYRTEEQDGRQVEGFVRQAGVVRDVEKACLLSTPLAVHPEQSNETGLATTRCSFRAAWRN